MAGHAPAATAAAVAERYAKGATLMLPTEDSIWAAGELDPPLRPAQVAAHPLRDGCEPLRDPARTPDHGPPAGFSCSATATTARSTRRFIVVGPDGRPVSSDGNVGPPVDPTETTAVVEFNDAEALERVLREEEIACVLTEPALTNIGIVLPEPGFHDALRELTRETGTLLADRRDAHLQRRAGWLHGGIRARARPADHRQGDRRRGAGGRLRHERRRSRTAILDSSTPTTRTRAGSAAPWRATRCRRRRSAPPSTRS